jgi:hypothetical protein
VLRVHASTYKERDNLSQWQVMFQNEGSRFDWSCSHFTLQKDNKNKNKAASISTNGTGPTVSNRHV